MLRSSLKGLGALPISSLRIASVIPRDAIVMANMVEDAPKNGQCTADGKFIWVAPDATGIAVTASTGDLITVTNSSSGTAVTYDVVIIGASA